MRFLGGMAFVALASLSAASAGARTFDFKALGTKGTSSGGMYWYSTVEKNKSAFFQVTVGSAGKTDDKSELEIRAATVFKNAKNKTTGVNDVAKLAFEPVNTMKPIRFIVATGSAKSLTDKYWVDSARSYGWQVSGAIIEIWQNGKVVKHWSNIPGNGGKAKLDDGVRKLMIWADGHDRSYHSSSAQFDNATEIFAVDQKGERAKVEDLIAACSEK